MLAARVVADVALGSQQPTHPGQQLVQLRVAQRLQSPPVALGQIEHDILRPQFKDPRIHHFYDPNKRSGAAIADCLGYMDRVAWDIYLFYTAGATWIETPPAPAAWMHQLSETWLDREHYHKGDDLIRELSLAMQRLLGS